MDTKFVIEENLPSEFKEFEKTRLVRDAVYKEVESVIEFFLDICAIINSDLRLGPPEIEDDILKHLELKKIFDQKVFEFHHALKGVVCVDFWMLKMHSSSA